jgi:hypothetical protein
MIAEVGLARLQAVLKEQVAQDGQRDEDRGEC